MDLTSLKNIMRVEESDVDAYIYIGHMRIANIEEEDGLWYASTLNPFGGWYQMGNGFETKQAALEAMVKYLSD